MAMTFGLLMAGKPAIFRQTIRDLQLFPRETCNGGGLEFFRQTHCDFTNTWGMLYFTNFT